MPLRRWGCRGIGVMRSCVPRGTRWVRRGVGAVAVDRERIVVVFTATGSLQAAATASGISASAARRVLVAEGLVDEARRPRDKVAAKRRFLELVGSGWSARRAAREVGVNERTGRDWRDGFRTGRNTRIHPDGTVVDYTTGSRYTSAVITTARDVVRPISDRYLSLQNRLAIADGLLTAQTPSPNFRCGGGRSSGNPTPVVHEAFSDPDALGDLLRPNTLSVGVRRDIIFRSTLVTATTRTGKPCISFFLNTTAESSNWWFVVCRVPAIQGG